RLVTRRDLHSFPTRRSSDLGYESFQVCSAEYDTEYCCAAGRDPEPVVLNQTGTAPESAGRTCTPKGQAMKVLPHMLLGVALLFAICSTFNTVHAQADSVEIDNGFFYDRLSPHGDWVNTTEHGWTWQPSDADGEFRPYTQGSWVYTDDSGWYWHSATEHGWATEHYGRWTKVDSKWNWVPGNEWSG